MEMYSNSEVNSDENAIASCNKFKTFIFCPIV